LWRRFAGAALALALTAVSGCVGYTAEADSAPWGSMTPTCALTGLDAAAPVVHEPQVTAAHEVVVKGGRVDSSVPLSDGPAEPRITWTAPKMATVDDVVRQVPPEARQRFSTGRSPGGERVSAAVSGLGTDDGTFIGYAAIRPVEVTFTGTCADGDAVSGHLIAWTDPDVGVVKCGAALGAGASAGGRLAQAERC
jgi:hypothetical protein